MSRASSSTITTSRSRSSCQGFLGRRLRCVLYCSHDPMGFYDFLQDLLFEMLIAFGRKLKVSVRKAADHNGRDLPESYVRREIETEVSGVFQLVAAWRAIGQKKVSPPTVVPASSRTEASSEGTEAGPSKDVTKTVTAFQESLKLLAGFSSFSTRLDDLLKYFDEPQHAHFTNVKVLMQAKNLGYRVVSELDASYFQGRSLIFNRATERHTDKPDHNWAYTPVLTLGPYKKGIFRFLNVEVQYLSGALVLIRGGAIPHEVEFDGGQRVAVAHFSHNDTIQEVCKDNVPITTLAELQKRRAAWREENTRKKTKVSGQNKAKKQRVL